MPIWVTDISCTTTVKTNYDKNRGSTSTTEVNEVKYDKFSLPHTRMLAVIVDLHVHVYTCSTLFNPLLQSELIIDMASLPVSVL